MVKKLTQIGNSVALIIDKPIAELLHMAGGSSVEISTDGKRLIIEPVAASERDRRVSAAIGRVAEVYADTFRKLAK